MRWDKQAPAADPDDIVNYSGSVAEGLRFESSTGQAIALDPQTIAHLFATLRACNPLWDSSDAPGSKHLSDHLRDEFTRLVAGPWSLADPAVEAQRFHRVLKAEGHELPRIGPLDAVQAVVGHEVIFFERRNVCLARLTSVERDDAPVDDADSTVRLEFDVIALPGLEWPHGSPFTVGASEEYIYLDRGYFSVSMTNVVVITAPELITNVRTLLSRELDPRMRTREIRRLLERRGPERRPAEGRAE
jgi:hypothetical protein